MLCVHIFVLSNFNSIANILKKTLKIYLLSPFFGLIFNYIFNIRKVLATPLYLKVSVPYQESERSCIKLVIHNCNKNENPKIPHCRNNAKLKIARSNKETKSISTNQTIHDLSPSRHGTDTSR
jgi:hypothetical protein